MKNILILLLLACTLSVSAENVSWLRYPSISPDGKRIIYSSLIQDPASSALFPKSSMTELYSVSISGGRPQ